MATSAMVYLPSRVATRFTAAADTGLGTEMKRAAKVSMAAAAAPDAAAGLTRRGRPTVFLSAAPPTVGPHRRDHAHQHWASSSGGWGWRRGPERGGCAGRGRWVGAVRAVMKRPGRCGRDGQRQQRTREVILSFLLDSLARYRRQTDALAFGGGGAAVVSERDLAVLSDGRRRVPGGETSTAARGRSPPGHKDSPLHLHAVRV